MRWGPASGNPASWLHRTLRHPVTSPPFFLGVLFASSHLAHPILVGRIADSALPRHCPSHPPSACPLTDPCFCTF